MPGRASRIANDINSGGFVLFHSSILVYVYSTLAMESRLPIRIIHQPLPTTLLQLLSNSLILSQSAPYLPLASLLALGVTSKSFRALIRDSPTVFRYLDLTKVRTAQFEIAAIDHGGEVWRNVQLDENVTEDE